MVTAISLTCDAVGGELQFFKVLEPSQSRRDFPYTPSPLENKRRHAVATPCIPFRRLLLRKRLRRLERSASSVGIGPVHVFTHLFQLKYTHMTWRGIRGVSYRWDGCGWVEDSRGCEIETVRSESALVNVPSTIFQWAMHADFCHNKHMYVATIYWSRCDVERSKLQQTTQLAWDVPCVAMLKCESHVSRLAAK